MCVSEEDTEIKRPFIGFNFVQLLNQCESIKRSKGYLMPCVRKSELNCPPFLSALQMEDDSIYNMSQNRGYSVPPPLPTTCNAEPSELYRVSVSFEASSASLPA